MKKQLLFLSFCIIAVIGLAQVPYKMSYQTVVRNSSNLLVNNQQVGIKVSLLQGGATGTAVFTQLFTPTTNANGLASIAIGDTSPTFVNINWGSGPFFIKTEIDPTGGNNYTIEGVSELMSVPYAVYARYTSNQGKNTLIISGDISDAEAAAKILRDVGPNTQHIRIEYTHNLTNIDFSIIKAPINTIDIEVIHNDKLASINFGPLESNEDYFSMNNNYILKNISFSNFKTSEGDISIYDAVSQIAFPNFEHVLGKLVLVTDSSFTSLDFPKLKYVGNILDLQIPNIQNIYAPLLETTGELNLSNKPFLQSINFPSLKTFKGKVTFNKDSLLTKIYLPSLISYGNPTDYWSYTSQFNINNDSSLTKIEMPNLVRTYGYFNIGGCNKLTTIDLSNLQGADDLFIVNDSSLQALNLPALDTVTRLTISNNNTITNISIPNVSVISAPSTKRLVQAYPQFYITNNALLSNFNMPVISNSNTNLNFGMNNNKLTSTCINNILNSFVLSNITSAITTSAGIGINNQTPPAPPTGAGITDKATLISRGISVNTD